MIFDVVLVSRKKPCPSLMRAAANVGNPVLGPTMVVNGLWSVTSVNLRQILVEFLHVENDG